MSHTVTLNVSNLTEDIKCSINRNQKILNELISENNNDKKFVEYLEKYKQNLLKKLNEHGHFKNGFSENKISYDPYNLVSVNTIQGLEILRKIDSFNKEVANIMSNKNLINLIVEDYENEQSEIMNIIEDVGKIAEQAILNLRSKSEKISAINIKNEIDKIRNAELDLENQKRIKNDLFDLIETYNFNNSIEFELIKMVDSKKSIQELNDCFTFISSKKIEEDKIDNFAKLFFEKLREIEGFQIPNEPIKYIFDTDGIIRKIYKLKNLKNKAIEISIDGRLQISYQYGNYEGHACEKTTDKIFQAIKENGWKIDSYTITRNISNASPLFAQKSFNK